MATALEVAEALGESADPVRAEHALRFFKTGPGEYGEGDRFIGVTVPRIRIVAKQFAELRPAEVEKLLASPLHEHRLCALIIWVNQFTTAGRPKTRDEALRDDLHGRYLAALDAGRVNGWDLVDTSCQQLIGAYLLEHPSDLLDRLAASPMLWERRAAMVATFAFIRAGDAEPTLALAERMLGDDEDLSHKAVGWMLREVGNRVNPSLLAEFLETHAGQMPRVMLSYATEKLAPDDRVHYRAIARG